MPIVYQTGNIFTTNADIIGHGCNTYGVMGAGIAKQVATHFPYAKDCYVKLCREEKFHLGDVQFVDCDRIIIANMATQIQPGPDARYKGVYKCMMKLMDFASENSYNIAIPKIGCGIGNLNWVVTHNIIKYIAYQYPNTILEIWTFNANS